MQLQESGEMYLESIYVLNKSLEHVRSIDICDFMGYSKPSISKAVHLLQEGGYIDIDSQGFITLSADGAAIAEKIYERHTVLTDFFTSIGVGADTAREDACRIEHDISDESFEALKSYLSKSSK